MVVTEPHPGAAPAPGGWPPVIGAIAIVFGAIGAICGVAGLLGAIFTEVFAELMPPDQVHAMDAAIALRGWTMTLNVTGTLLALVLLVGGFGVTMRRRFGARLCVGWAIVKMVYVVPVATLSYFTNEGTFSTWPGVSESPSPLVGGALRVMVVSMVLFILCWGWILPIFLLVWFRGRRVRSEVAGW